MYTTARVSVFSWLEYSQYEVYFLNPAYRIASNESVQLKLKSNPHLKFAYSTLHNILYIYICCRRITILNSSVCF